MHARPSVNRPPVGLRSISPTLGVILCVCLLASPSLRAEPALDKTLALLSAASASGVPADRFQSTTEIHYRASITQGARQYVVGDDAVVHKYGDGNRLHIVIDLLDYLSPTGAVIVRPSRRELLFDPHVRTMWWYPADKPLSGSAQQSTSAKRTQALKLIADSDVATGCFLDGFVDGRGNIADLVRNLSAPFTVGQQSVNGIDCSVVEARTASTYAAVWIAPAQGNSIVKYVLQQTDAIAGKSNAEFEATAFRSVDGRSFVSAGRSRRSWTDPQTHAHWRETVDADRTELNLQPQFNQPNLFTTHDVPNGMRCFLDDLPNVGVDFVWDNGKPVPKADPDLFDDLGRSVQRTMSGEVSKAVPVVAASFDSSFDNSLGDEGGARIARLWTVLIGAAAVLATLMILLGLWKRRSRGA